MLYVTSGHYANTAAGLIPAHPHSRGGRGVPAQTDELPSPLRDIQGVPRCYRELPLRLAEFGTVYRYEQSGELHGLTRVRGFTQDDAHIFCAPAQIKTEFLKVMDIIFYIFKALKFDNLRGSDFTSRPQNKGEIHRFRRELAPCRAGHHRSLRRKRASTPAPNSVRAAFWSRDSTSWSKDAIGRRWQLGSIQVDYNLPNASSSNIPEPTAKAPPVMIHRAPSVRWSVLWPYSSSTPPDDSPVARPDQAVVLPISEKFSDYAYRALQASLRPPI